MTKKQFKEALEAATNWGHAQDEDENPKGQAWDDGASLVVHGLFSKAPHVAEYRAGILAAVEIYQKLENLPTDEIDAAIENLWNPTKG